MINSVISVTRRSTAGHVFSIIQNMSNFAKNETFANGFLEFLNESCTAFHAVEACKKRLNAAGFLELSEKDRWQLNRGGKYYFSRDDSSLMGFYVGTEFANSKPGCFTAIGAHTDSPCLRLKPVTCVQRGDSLMLNTQPYGGGLWHTWFDRDLGLAGRVVMKGADGSMQCKLFRIDTPIARIPNLAIHLTAAEDRNNFSPNLHEHAKAILSMDPDFIATAATEGEKDTATRIHPALLRMVAKSIDIDPELIEDIECQLIDTQPACLGGACNELLYGGRLDNLCSTYQSLQALIDSAGTDNIEQTNCKLVMLFNHEEVGSNSSTGAGSSMFMNTIQLINDQFSDGSHASLMTALRNSFVVSIDMAHALHPNYTSKHDQSMAPKINQGLVIKTNANQRYATNCVSATMFRRIGKLAGLPVQDFTVRSDAGCGSTIGPIIATLSGVMTIDVGTPQFSMHSIREMMGSRDVYTGYAHLMATLEHHPRMAAHLNDNGTSAAKK